VKSNPDLADTKVLIVSGVVNQSEIDDLSEHGADGFLKKPFDVSELMALIEELVVF
jgi:DNA-binding NarL/FixJ family response regulator